MLNIDLELAKQVAHQLGLSPLPKSAPIFCTKKKNQLHAPSLSLLLNQPNTFKGRKLGIILTEKSNFHLAGHLETLTKKQGGIIEIIAPKILNFKNKRFKPQQSFETAISASYDAIAVLARSKDLLKYNELKLFTFLQESFHQCKFIAYIAELTSIFKKLDLKSDPGIILLKNIDSCQLFIKHCKKLRYWERYKI